MSAIPEVELSPGTLLFGDLHLDLDGEGEDLTRFEAWLEEVAAAPALVILGDLFEYWIGPAHARSPGGARALAALAAATGRGARVELVPGNRDFLLGADLTRATGVRVHPEGFVGRTAAARVLVLHGDTLCTGDVGYLRLRRVLRSAPVRGLGPRLPAVLGRAVARRLRRASRAAVDRKAPLDVAIQAEEAARQLAAADCDTLVCGHAHAWRDEALDGGGRLLVLDAFGGPRGVARVGGDGRVTVEAPSEAPARP